MVFTEQQEKIIKGAVHHIKGNETDDQVYQIQGSAGTGKTTVLFEIIKRIGIPMENVATMTFIGQASIVLRSKGIRNAKTAHSWLYQPVEVPVMKDGKNVIDPVYNKPLTRIEFVPKDLEEIEYIVIDEAWTMPRKMKYEIESRGLKIIAVGDKKQLPPVGDQPAYLVDGKINYLTEIMRQKKGSNILTIADHLSKGYQISPGYYGDVLVIEDKDLNDEMIKSSNIIVCGTNATRDKFNRYVRQNILHIDQKLPRYGEKVICRKNEWNLDINGISLANGLIGSVVRELSPLDIDIKKKTFNIDFRPDLFNGIFRDLKCDYDYFTANFTKRNDLKNNRYNTASKFEYAYTITTHLSQGAQYPSGIYLKEHFKKDLQPNLDYTGVTRFSDYVIIVLPTKKYY